MHILVNLQLQNHSLVLSVDIKMWKINQRNQDTQTEILVRANHTHHLMFNTKLKTKFTAINTKQNLISCRFSLEFIKLGNLRTLLIFTLFFEKKRL